jgi:hypothetical protein
MSEIAYFRDVLKNSLKNIVSFHHVTLAENTYILSPLVVLEGGGIGGGGGVPDCQIPRTSEGSTQKGNVRGP